MATGVNKLSSVVGLAEEVTEGTYVAPTDFVQPLEGFEGTSGREELERQIITPNIGNASPRAGLKSTTASIPLEYKANGVEGAAPESDLLLKNALGDQRQITTQNTTKAAGNTASNLKIEDADIGDYTVGDFIVVLESGANHGAFITAVDPTGGSANIEILPAASGAFSASVVISKSTTYFVKQSGFTSLSLSVYWGDEILEKTLGAKVTSMALENFATGQLPSINFGMQGLDFDRIDGSSAGASYTTGLPPVVLNACVYQDGSVLSLNNFSLSLENEIVQLKDMCTSSGITGQRVTKRTITGSYDPFMDDTTFDQFTLFNNNTEYSLIVVAYTPSTTAGEYELGSVVGIYLPQVKSTAVPISATDNILIDAVEYKATAGSAGDQDDIYMGFV